MSDVSILILEKLKRDSQAQVVGTVMGRPVTRGQLSAAFDLVASANWKDPIDKIVDLNDRQMAMIREAVVFFTGSVPEFLPRLGAKLPRCRYRVRAAGYYATIGA